MLDEAVLTGLASIDVTFEADHPRYGCGEYAYAIHDGFPGTIIATVDALLGWNLIDRCGLGPFERQQLVAKAA